MDWGLIAPMLGALTALIVGFGGILQNREPTRKLERLATIREKVKPGSEALRKIDEAIDRLAEKVRNRELFSMREFLSRPLSRRRPDPGLRDAFWSRTRLLVSMVLAMLGTAASLLSLMSFLLRE